MYLLRTYTTNMWIFFHLFYMLNYWNSNIGIFILRSLISVKMIVQIFGTINKRGVQISSGGWKTNQNIASGGRGDAYLAFKSNLVGSAYFGL